MPSSVAEAYLALGSNLGDRRVHLRAALSALEAHDVHVRQASSLFETAPMYRTDQPAFLNAVVRVETELSPEDLLRASQEVERLVGRQPRERFGPREIDVDILLYGGERRESAELTIPHPRMAERPFVLVPLAELRGDPVSGLMPIEGPEWSHLDG
jgi:2-amino-4-hydroxy-6-hydroxymethyldihydropteridine diphosphokinase